MALVDLRLVLTAGLAGAFSWGDFADGNACSAGEVFGAAGFCAVSFVAEAAGTEAFFVEVFASDASDAADFFAVALATGALDPADFFAVTGLAARPFGPASVAAIFLDAALAAALRPDTGFAGAVFALAADLLLSAAAALAAAAVLREFCVIAARFRCYGQKAHK